MKTRRSTQKTIVKAKKSNESIDEALSEYFVKSFAIKLENKRREDSLVLEELEDLIDGKKLILSNANEL